MTKHTVRHGLFTRRAAQPPSPLGALVPPMPPAPEARVESALAAESARRRVLRSHAATSPARHRR
jgi:hypothetical protein